MIVIISVGILRVIGKEAHYLEIGIPKVVSAAVHYDTTREVMTYLVFMITFQLLPDQKEKQLIMYFLDFLGPYAGKKATKKVETKNGKLHSLSKECILLYN